MIVKHMLCNVCILDFPADLFQKPASAYSEEQRTFALTLHLYGAKAYDYLRDEVGVHLPHPRTLCRYPL